MKKKLYSARCDHWATSECCNAPDKGSSCDRDLILSDLSAIYHEWFAAGQWCDRSHGVLVEVCEYCTQANFEGFANSVTERVNEIVNPTGLERGPNKRAAARLTKVIRNASK